MKYLLFPFALIYKLIIWFRNSLFNLGVFQSVEYPTKLISVGNLAMGGTGKTPHVEYLINLLGDNENISILSRGYKRKTKGYLEATNNSKSFEIGDEPKQYVTKFDNTRVFVSESRRTGIKNILDSYPSTECIILDDAYQHRWVKPGLSILLSDYHDPFYEDSIVPVGRLREPRKNYDRADIIIITKAPTVLSPIDYKITLSKIKPLKHQKIFFSYIKYGQITPVFSQNGFNSCNEYNTIVLFTGIANTYPLEDYLKLRCTNLITVKFPDHHDFSLQDLKKVTKEFDDQFTRNKIILTTEKDYMRLVDNQDFLDHLQNFPVFYLPIKVKIHKKWSEDFDQTVKSYVKEN